MPDDCGSTRVSTICAAITASTALPPWRSMARPASAASGLAAEIIWRLAWELAPQPAGRSAVVTGAQAPTASETVRRMNFQED